MSHCWLSVIKHFIIGFVDIDELLFGITGELSTIKLSVIEFDESSESPGLIW